MDKAMKLSLEDIGSRYKSLIPIWTLGTGADFGRLNPYARHISFGLLVIMFYKELLDDLKRTRNDLIDSVVHLANQMQLPCTEEEAEKIVDAIMVNANSKKHTFSFQEQYFNDETNQWETFRFQYLEIDRDVSDLDEGILRYKLTNEAQELFLNTNEIQKQLPMTIQQLLVELLIEKGELKSALRMLDALNSRVQTLLKEEKIHKDELLRNPKETLYRHKTRWNQQLEDVQLQFQEEADKYAKMGGILKKLIVTVEYQSTYFNITKRLIKTRSLHDKLAKLVIENIRLEFQIRNKYFRALWLSSTTSFRKSIWEEQARAVGFAQPEVMLDLAESIFSPKKPSILPLEWGIDNQMELPLNTFSSRTKTTMHELDPLVRDWESILSLWKPIFDKLIASGIVAVSLLDELEEAELSRWVENREAFDFWVSFAALEEPLIINDLNLQDGQDDRTLFLAKLIEIYPEYQKFLFHKQIWRIPAYETMILQNKVDTSAFILTLTEVEKSESSTGAGSSS